MILLYNEINGINVSLVEKVSDMAGWWAEKYSMVHNGAHDRGVFIVMFNSSVPPV